MTGRLTIRDVDTHDLEVLRSAARDRGTSLNRYIIEVLHQQAQREHHRRLFASVAAQDVDIPVVDAVSEVRALRREKDAQDDERATRP